MPALRAISDRHVVGIAKTGGLVGIAYFKSDTESRTMRRAVELIDDAGMNGIDHIALGSDYDGSVTVPFDASELVLLTHELTKAEHGFSDSDIRKIMGANLRRILLRGLP